MNTDAPSVLIVGGGLAGLAAAVALAPRGFRVTVLESRPRLGGRAGSFSDPGTGQLVDACQHVSMGCCTNLAHFLRTVGVGHLLAKQPTLYFMTPDRRVSRFAADPWPAPFHLGRALAGAHYLTAGDKLRIGYGLAALLREPPDADPPLLDWLRRHRQNQRTIDRFWGMVLTSALNETVDRVGLKYARKVFRDGFVRHRDGFVVEVPMVPLGHLYGDELRGWLSRHGVDVRENTGVKSLSPLPSGEGGRGEGRSGGGQAPLSELSAREGEAPAQPCESRGSAGASPSRGSGSGEGFEREAVPTPHPQPLSPAGRGEEEGGGQVAAVLPSPRWGEGRREVGGVRGRDSLPGGSSTPPQLLSPPGTGEPIRSALLRDGTTVDADDYVLAVPFDRVLDLVPEPLRADPYFANVKNLAPSPITSVHLWFDRPVLDRPHVVLVDCLGQWVFNRGQVAPGEFYLQVVVSAARPLRGLGRDEVQRQILDELGRLFPGVQTATLLRAKVVTEHTATFSAVPGVDRWRPPQASPVPNLVLAGDWTRTGWPATMEGAVRSGYLAAEAILARHGRPEKLIQPELGE